MKYYLSIAAVIFLAGCVNPTCSNPTSCATTPAHVLAPTTIPTQYKAHPSVSYVEPRLECAQTQAVVTRATVSSQQIIQTPMAHCQPVLKDKVIISVTGQGVAPANTTSPAQAYALAKRAAIADAYRLIAEKIKGVRVDGQDLIQDMMVKRSTVRTAVEAMIRNANIVETNYKEGLCEVSMEIALTRSQLNF